MGRNYNDQYLEWEIESHFTSQVKLKLEGIAYKFTSPNKRSVPDRMVVLPPDGKIVFVELKATGKLPTHSQEREHKRLRDLGCEVFTIDHKSGTDKWVAFMLSGKKGGASTQESIDEGFII